MSDWPRILLWREVTRGDGSHALRVREQAVFLRAYLHPMLRLHKACRLVSRYRNYREDCRRRLEAPEPYERRIN